MKEKATVMRDVALAALRGEINDRVARTYCQGNKEVRHDITIGQKVGENAIVLHDGEPGGTPINPREEELRRREEELTAELEAIREQRGA